MEDLEGITAKIEQTHIIDKTLQAKVGNQPRDDISIKVRWSAMDILRAEYPQRRIKTFGVAICYAVLGTNTDGDVILGHYAPSVERETALQLVRYLINQQNLVNKDRQLNYDSFTFSFIQGPAPFSYCDVYYDRGEGLVVTTHKPGKPLNWETLTIYDKKNPLEVIYTISKNSK